jgi:hypothetical protein
MGVAMKQRYWKVQIEKTASGIKAAIIKTRDAERKPGDEYKNNPGMEAWGVWYNSEDDAKVAVLNYLKDKGEAVE